MDRLLGSASIDLAAALSRACGPFDDVLVNAPPLARSAEGLRVFKAIDAVVLLVRPRRTTLEDFHRALGLLQRARGRPDGLLVLSGSGRRRPRPRAPRQSASVEPAAQARAFARPGS